MRTKLRWAIVVLLFLTAVASFIAAPNVGSAVLFIFTLFLMPVRVMEECWSDGREENKGECEEEYEGEYEEYQEYDDSEEDDYRQKRAPGSFLKFLLKLFIVLLCLTVIGYAHNSHARARQIAELAERIKAISAQNSSAESYQPYAPQGVLDEQYGDAYDGQEDYEPEEYDAEGEQDDALTQEPASAFSMDMVPEFDGQLYYEINGNMPFFTEDELTTDSYESYSPLDELGRCGVACACVGVDIMPTEPRGDIGMIKPTGWMISKYDFIDGKYLYNRSHLIAFQLAGENANECNLITGTRFMNAQSMEPFESMVGDYVRSTKNHVMYRVTPIFEGNNLLADGVLMEAYSVEDDGEGICFCIFCHNAQPRVGINYEDGSNWLLSDEETSYYEAADTPDASEPVTAWVDDTDAETILPFVSDDETEYTYVINVKTHKFHCDSCKSIADIKEKNKLEITASRDELIRQGYEPCGVCHP